MKTEIKEVEINGILYVPKEELKFTSISTDRLEVAGDIFIRESSIVALAPKLNDKEFVLVRTYSAGVHFGYLNKKESTLAGIEVQLLQARRVWYWKGAASLSQMANEGVKFPNECKFTQVVEKIDLVAIEIISITNKAFINLSNVPVWQI